MFRGVRSVGPRTPVTPSLLVTGGVGPAPSPHVPGHPVHEVSRRSGSGTSSDDHADRIRVVPCRVTLAMSTTVRTWWLQSTLTEKKGPFDTGPLSLSRSPPSSPCPDMSSEEVVSGSYGRGRRYRTDRGLDTENGTEDSKSVSTGVQTTDGDGSEGTGVEVVQTLLRR